MIGTDGDRRVNRESVTGTQRPGNSEGRFWHALTYPPPPFTLPSPPSRPASGYWAALGLCSRWAKIFYFTESMTPYGLAVVAR
ncbi:hypothetical protein E2C01_009995 [Portunus trituberculatus]|uniref:Uncharacterized protein n=1 Tax=Portunus trituberculatus TaxID=210409 RepID=A0A5B7D771_PORTR|nr:hypothetical protein [Portunus trituberculatus]